MFYEKMETILPNCKIIITDGNTQTMYPVESFTNPIEVTNNESNITNGVE